MDHIRSQRTLLSEHQTQPPILLPSYIPRQPTLAPNFLVDQSRLRRPLVLRLDFGLCVPVCAGVFLLGAKLLEIP